MAKPTQAKEPDNKEKDKNEGGGANSILINVITTTIVCIIFIGVNYFLQSNLLTTQLQSITAEQNADEDMENLDKPEKGIVLDLGDFTMNLSDIEPRRYLKANVAIEITNPEPDPTQQEEQPKASGGHGGHGEAAPADPKAAIVAEMEQYKPAIRDAVITVLTSKTSDELASTAGKELAKQQIAEAVNGIFDGEREVIRVSFGQFIMKKKKKRER